MAMMAIENPCFSLKLLGEYIEKKMVDKGMMSMIFLHKEYIQEERGDIQ